MAEVWRGGAGAGSVDAGAGAGDGCGADHCAGWVMGSQGWRAIFVALMLFGNVKKLDFNGK